LFDPKASEEYPRDEDHLALTMELIGQMPKEMIRSATKAKTFFNPRGELRHIKALNTWGLADVLAQKYKQNSSDAAGFAQFLSEMLVLEPAKRSSATKLKCNAWLNAEATFTVQHIALDSAGRVLTASVRTADGPWITLMLDPAVTVKDAAHQLQIDKGLLRAQLVGPQNEVFNQRDTLVSSCTAVGLQLAAAQPSSTQ